MKDLKQIEEEAEKFKRSDNMMVGAGHDNLNVKRHSFVEGAKSQSAKEYHQQGMYTEIEVFNLLKKLSNGEIPINWLNAWFYDRKKK